MDFRVHLMVGLRARSVLGGGGGAGGNRRQNLKMLPSPSISTVPCDQSPCIATKGRNISLGRNSPLTECLVNSNQ